MKQKLIAVVSLIISLSCSVEDEGKAASTISINERNANIKVGEYFKFTATRTPSVDNASIDLKWSSSDENTVVVDEYGRALGVSDGYAVISVRTLYSPILTDSVKINISPIEVESITIDRDLSIISGDRKCFSVKYHPHNAKKREIEWISSNENIAKVTPSGCVTTVNVGHCTITARIKGTNISASSSISILKKSSSGGNGGSGNLSKAVQCSGRTKKGRRCSRMTTNINGRCWQHQ